MKPGRRPYPKERERPRTRFTPDMWSRWLREQPWAKVPPDNRTLRLREGIREFRRYRIDTGDHTMKNETNIDVLNEYTERRIRAYLASMVPRGELSTEEERGRSLIEQIALSAQGDDHPPIRLSADRCADVLDFMASVEPLEPRNWWKSPEDAPSHVVGLQIVLHAVEESIRRSALPGVQS